MAPTIKQRSSTRSRVSKPSSSTRTSTSNQIEALFKSSKDDKRRIKHSSLISRIEKANQKPKKRRRPSKKLIANLESIADALPELCKDDAAENSVGNAPIRHKSLKSKPGAMKKKEKLEQMERERFSKNMVQMADLRFEGASALENSTVSGASTGTESSKRWAALREFIHQTMDRDPIEKRKCIP